MNNKWISLSWKTDNKNTTKNDLSYGGRKTKV
jgi:hypothetical protein